MSCLLKRFSKRTRSKLLLHTSNWCTRTRTCSVGWTACLLRIWWAWSLRRSVCCVRCTWSATASSSVSVSATAPTTLVASRPLTRRPSALSARRRARRPRAAGRALLLRPHQAAPARAVARRRARRSRACRAPRTTASRTRAVCSRCRAARCPGSSSGAARTSCPSWTSSASFFCSVCCLVKRYYTSVLSV